MEINRELVELIVREVVARLQNTTAPNQAPSAGRQAPAFVPSAAIECAPVVRRIEEYVTSAMADDPSCQPCAAKLRAAIDQCVDAGACRIGTFGESDTQAHGGVNRMIDHTLLKATTIPEEIEKLCAEARQYHFKSVCINPGYVSLCKRLLQGSGVLVCTVVGFPLGATTTAAKAAETRDAVADGADEIDMVINIGALKSGDYEKVKHDIEAVVEAAKGRTTKVIFETHLLTDEEKVAACQLSVAAGAHFVKTATGFSGGGATAEDIALMRRVVGPALGVKASGGVRSREDADKMIQAGANRIGASASIEIVTGKKSQSKGY
jgi:deoxyribose-phosphate aldolase